MKRETYIRPFYVAISPKYNNTIYRQIIKASTPCKAILKAATEHGIVLQKIVYAEVYEYRKDTDKNDYNKNNEYDDC